MCSSDRTALAGGCALLLLLVVGVGATAQLQRLWSEEVPRRLQAVLQRTEEVLRCLQSCCAEGYADLFAQPSPAVPLQWTYRDGRLVNLPVSLLVEGDIIALRPGAAAPAELRGVQEEQHVVLSPLDSCRPRPHNLLRPQLFRVIGTPAVDSTQRCLELGQRWPATVLDNERYALQSLLERAGARAVPQVWHRGPSLFCSYRRCGGWSAAASPASATRPASSTDWAPSALPSPFISVTRTHAPRGEPAPSARVPACVHVCAPVLCRADKQGVLSWPSPNPEKVLFFSQSAGS
nr:transmembrane protein 94-like [Paramormyrops kingsleyae]